MCNGSANIARRWSIFHYALAHGRAGYLKKHSFVKSVTNYFLRRIEMAGGSIKHAYWDGTYTRLIGESPTGTKWELSLTESDSEELLYQLDVALKERDDDFMRKSDEK